MKAKWFTALSVILVAMVVEQCQAADITVSGYVHDSSMKPITGVKVMLFTHERSDKNQVTRTDGNGYYEFKKSPGKSFDMHYAHSLIGHCMVTHLSGDKEQQISKVLLTDARTDAAAAVFDSLEVLERIGFQSVHAPETFVQLVEALRRNDMMPQLSAINVAVGDKSQLIKDKEMRTLLQSKLLAFEKVYGNAFD